MVSPGKCMFLLLLNNLSTDQVTGNGLSKSTFYVSFDNSEESSNEWIEFKNLMPELGDFSVCHWDKPRSFNDNVNVIWNYCFTSKYENDIDCFELYFDLIDSTANRHILIGFHITLTNSKMERKVYRLKADIQPYKHRTWNHYCWLYSNITKQNSLYWNGNFISSMILPNDAEVAWAGQKNRNQSAFVIGEEQDKIRGGYQQTQAFTGDIAELNIWNYTLSANEIHDLSNCKTLFKGNVRSWEIANLLIYEAKVVKEFDWKLFCETEKRLVIFPTRLPLHVAEDLCEIHGGKIVTPYTDFENKKVVEIVNQHYASCIDPKMTDKRNCQEV